MDLIFKIVSEQRPWAFNYLQSSDTYVTLTLTAGGSTLNVRI